MKKRVLSILLVILIAQFIPAYADAGFSSNPDAIEQAAKSVLMLQVFDSNDKEIGTGSGFVAFNNRTIITNYHVIDGADWMIANSDDGYQYMVTKVLIADEEKDIAICGFMSPTDLQPLEFNTEGELKRAESIVAIGSPIGITNTVSLGNISALYKDDGVSWIQFTAPISHGSSGGALFDNEGKIIGVTSASYIDTQNLNLAVHISEVESLYNSWDGVESKFDKYTLITKATPTPAPTPAPTPGSYTVLRIGDVGPEVNRLQEALIRLGYLTGEPSAEFDIETKQAVLNFNYQNFGSRAAIADVKMQRLLFEGNPKPYDPAVTLSPTTTPKPTVVPKSYDTLQEGDSGEAVRLLQEKLIDYGYLNSVATGIFDEETKKAVKLFNEFNLSNPNDKAFPEMQRLIFEGNPAKYNPAYTALQRGDRNETVKRLQQELIKLGYLEGTADGIFGAQTEEAVKAFNKQNFSSSSKKATPRTLYLLFEGQPKQFKDIDQALHFKFGSAYAEWYDLSGDKLKIHFQVTNRAKKKTVKAFELCVYATDIWGNRIYGTQLYIWTTTKNVSPGKSVYSDYITIPYRSDIKEVYCGINKIACTDGTVYTYPSVDYSCWEIR